MNTSILAIDDNEQFCLSLARMLSGNELTIYTALNSEAAFSLLKKVSINIILLDVRLGEESGIEVLIQCSERYPQIPVIMLTGFASIESAVQSIKLGAFDYIQKPIKYEKLTKIIHNACTMASLKKENKDLHERLEDLTPSILSQDSRIDELKKTITKLTTANIAILLYGENGTGKELFANYIHSKSSRKTQKIIKINCAAFPDSLLDNELFGHEKGAYTGANAVYKGVFEKAHQGTLFLDEIGDMSLEVQAKVLRVLQDKELYRLGGKDVIQVDVRIISATNKKLEVLIKEGKFREDLYYRLNAATLSIPPLRDRVIDITLLTDFILKEYSSVNGKIISGVSPEVAQFLKRYNWPGNIRELKNVLSYAAALSTNGKIELRDIPAQLLEKMDSAGTHHNTLEDSEKKLILKELIRTNFNKKKVAETLNISRTTLYSKIKKYGIG